MKKRAYRAVHLKGVNEATLSETVKGKPVTVGIDVAKQDMFAALMSGDGQVVMTLRWKHPVETPDFITLLLRLPMLSLAVAMEPTGTYGDALRYQMLARGLAVFRVSPKRVHDAREVYDGVPSSHDAKAGAIIARLHLGGASAPWPLAGEPERTLEAALRVMAMYDGQYQDNLNGLEALLARHWPEAAEVIDTDSVTFLTLLSTYGSPARIAGRQAEARRLMRRTGGRMLATGKTEAVLASALATVGVPMVEQEREALKTLAEDTLRAKKAGKAAARKVEKLTQNDPSVAAMGQAVGKVTAAVLTCKVGDPQSFGSARAYEKSAGLNLSERSSGKHRGRLKISKRGSGMARQYLYLAALRLIRSDPVVSAWYGRKVARDGGVKMKGVVAIMRKLIRALWYVARGDRFDATKLFDVQRLALATEP